MDTALRSAIALIALIAISGLAILDAADSATTNPAGLSVTINLGSIARVTVLVNVSAPGSHGTALSAGANDPGVSLRLTLAPGDQHRISYYSTDKEQTP